MAQIINLAARRSVSIAPDQMINDIVLLEATTGTPVYNNALAELPVDLYPISYRAHERRLEQHMSHSDTSIRVEGISYVATHAVVKGVASLVFILCCFFLAVGRLTGEHLVQPIVAVSLGFIAISFFGLTFLLKKRP